MRIVLFLFLVGSLHGQYLDNHLYVSQQKRVLICSNVDSYTRLQDYIFYKKSNRFYSYSIDTGENYFIDWNVKDFSLGPDDSLVYRKHSSFYVHQAPFKGKGRHITWNIDKYSWTVDGTLLMKKHSSFYILHNKFTDTPKLITMNIDSWLIGCHGEVAYLKNKALYFIDDKIKGTKITVQRNIDRAFFSNGTLYFTKSGALWSYEPETKTKKRLLYNVLSYYNCEDDLYVNTKSGLYIVSGNNVLFTGHTFVRNIKHSYRGISYLYRGRLYLITNRNVVELCHNPAWYSFSSSGCLYIQYNNNLCYLDDNFNINIIQERVCTPRFVNNRIYFSRNSRRYYLEPSAGKIILCK